MNATPSISKVPVLVTSRLDAAASALGFDTLSTPSETRVRPVKVLAPESVSVPEPSLFSAPVPEPLPLITPAKLPSLVWLTVSPPAPPLPSAICVPIAPARLPMDWRVSLRSKMPVPVRLTAPPPDRLAPLSRRSVPDSIVVPPA